MQSGANSSPNLPVKQENTGKYFSIPENNINHSSNYTNNQALMNNIKL
jgi:hypothetical protein